MEEIALIACTKKKLERRAPARELYRGILFRKSVRYAEAIGASRTFVLSGRHGLVPLDAALHPYDEALSAKSRSERREWAQRVLAQLRKVADLERDRFILLAPAPYRVDLLPHLAHAEVPLAGLPFGEQLRFLNDATRRAPAV